jgi:hypothetical protein
MPESSYLKQTGSFRVRDEVDGSEVEIAVISRFIDVSTMRSPKREWSENKRKRLYGPDSRELFPVESEEGKYYFEGEPNRIFQKVG